ncbi:hypothetical protein BASA50_011077 [Batrachochytrium salamandrivorans]|uniref:Uncharacterized protein n=1 Tax=Batrachochytrium salamandrivorans TaxID=1357716 RepID=A0ABQ8EWT0_9FUNG|nr:hypothetical protein BASA50_011077 [Batrachochytrium salamandrivorans]
MKFKVLVAIAMAITSVNANEIKDALICIGRACLPRPKPAPNLYISVSKPSRYRKSQKSMKKGSAEEAKREHICNPIISDLNTLWHINEGIDLTIRNQMPSLYTIIKDEKTNDENNNDDTSHSRFEEIKSWLGAYRKHIPELKELKVEHAGLMKEYKEAWKLFLKGDCPVKIFKWMSPDRKDIKKRLFSVIK